MGERPEKGLVEYLADRDVACLGCGYNLRGLVASACPECGARLRLRVLREGPRAKTCRWVFVGVAAQLGSCMLLWMLTGQAIKGDPDGQAGFAFLIPIGLTGLLALWGLLWFALAWPATLQRRLPRMILTQLLWGLVAATVLANGLCLRAIIYHLAW